MTDNADSGAAVAPTVAFSRFLHDLDAGDFHGRLSAELADTIRAMADHVRDTHGPAKAKLTMTFELKLGADGTVDVLPKVKTELPRPPVGRKIIDTGRDRGKGDRSEPVLGR